jgi:fido (protein-threonine AMPylation protein)
MSDWVEDSQQLQANIERLLSQASVAAIRRTELTLEVMKTWHRDLIRQLAVPDIRYVGRFRGEPGLEGIEVKIGRAFGVRSDLVQGELDEFQKQLRSKVKALDKQIKPGQAPGDDELITVIELCAWAHSEWVRIHPFANGNGRTARILANTLAMRYGLPPFVRIRPRPDGGYGNAGAASMKGDWRPTVIAFRRMYDGFILRPGRAK